MRRVAGLRQPLLAEELQTLAYAPHHVGSQAPVARIAALEGDDLLRQIVR
jgi:hypothetical protein